MDQDALARDYGRMTGRVVELEDAVQDLLDRWYGRRGYIRENAIEPGIHALERTLNRPLSRSIAPPTRLR